MISHKLGELLDDQVGRELMADQAYTGISIYVERRSLKRYQAEPLLGAE